MKSNEFNSDENKTPLESDNSTEYMIFEVPAENPPVKKRVTFNFWVFLRSLLLTLLIAILVVVGWRGGIFAVDYFTAKNDGMTHSEAFDYAWRGTVSFFTDIVDEVSPVMLQDKNILLIGSDKSKINADVIMLVQLDAESKSVDLISVLRDTRVEIGGRTHRINATLHIGGEELLVETVEDVLGVHIDNYVFVNYEGFRGVIDALDGVDFYVPQDMDYEDPEQDLYIHLKEGQQHLDGDKAEQLVRFRQYPMGDIQRTQVQRDFLTAIYKQKLNSDLVKKVRTLIPALMDFVDTDVNLTDALQYANFITDFDANSINAYQMPATPVDINGASYVIADKQGISEMFEEIRKSHEETPETTPEFNYRDDTVDANGELVN